MASSWCRTEPEAKRQDQKIVEEIISDKLIQVKCVIESHIQNNITFKNNHLNKQNSSKTSTAVYND